MPQSKIIVGVRVGLVGDKFVVNPTTKEMEDSDLDLVLAGSDNAILMIEVCFYFWIKLLHSVWNWISYYSTVRCRSYVIAEHL